MSKQSAAVSEKGYKLLPVLLTQDLHNPKSWLWKSNFERFNFFEVGSLSRECWWFWLGAGGWGMRFACSLFVVCFIFKSCTWAKESKVPSCLCSSLHWSCARGLLCSRRAAVLCWDTPQCVASSGGQWKECGVDPLACFRVGSTDSWREWGGRKRRAP